MACCGPVTSVLGRLLQEAGLTSGDVMASPGCLGTLVYLRRAATRVAIQPVNAVIGSEHAIRAAIHQKSLPPLPCVTACRPLQTRHVAIVDRLGRSTMIEHTNEIYLFT